MYWISSMREKVKDHTFMGLNIWIILSTDIVEKMREELWPSSGDRSRNWEFGFRDVEF